MRLIPDNVLPDPSIFLNMSEHNEVQSHSITSSDENKMDSCKREEWWTEATRIADQFESIQKTLDMTTMVSVFDFLIFLFSSRNLSIFMHHVRGPKSYGDWYMKFKLFTIQFFSPK